MILGGIIMSRKYFEEMTKEERKENVQNILEVLKRDNFMVINNHKVITF